MKYNFDTTVNRKNTNCFKHDALKQIFHTDDLLPLWVADMDFEAPDFINKAIIKRAEHPVYGYTFYSNSFYDSFINWAQKRHNYNIDASWIQMTPGVVTGISVAVMALTEPGDKIIIQPPVYTPFFQVVKENNRELVLNNLNEKDGHYTMDFEALEESIDEKTKMIIICNPHNPIGRVWTREELEKLVAICEKHNLLIIADEIHADIVYKPNEYTPILNISDYAKNNTIAFTAPSKTFNIAGLATSVAITPNKELRKKFKAMTSVLHFDGGNVFGTVAFEAAYTHGEEWAEQLLDYLKGNCEFAISYFAEHLPKLKITKPEGTYLLWLDFSALDIDDEELRRVLIEEAKVGLNHGSSFGANGKKHMRLNIGSPRAIIEEGVKRIAATMSKY